MKDKMVQEGEAKWFERYLPFVARGPEARVRWLVDALGRFLRKQESGNGGGMSPEEIGAYIRILLGNESLNMADYHRRGFAPSEDLRRIAPFFREVPREMVEVMVACVDIYDLPDLFWLIKNPSMGAVEEGLRKKVPPYETSPDRIVDRVFHAIYRQSPQSLAEVAAEISAADNVPEGFVEAYERFMEIVKDEEVLEELFPQAGPGDI